MKSIIKRAFITCLWLLLAIVFLFCVNFLLNIVLYPGLSEYSPRPELGIIMDFLIPILLVTVLSYQMPKTAMVTFKQYFVYFLSVSLFIIILYILVNIVFTFVMGTLDWVNNNEIPVRDVNEYCGYNLKECNMPNSGLIMKPQ